MSSTRYPGVKSLGDRRYLVRFKACNHKTGKLSEHKHIVEDCPSAAEAAKRRAALQTELAGAPVRLERVRLSTFVDTWIANKKPTLAPSTLDRYVSTMDNHVLPVLGDYYLDAITHADVIAWRDAQDAEPSTINSRLRVLKTALADAQIEHDLPRNPALRVAAIPTEHDIDSEPNSLTAEQLAVLLEAVRQHAPRWYALFATLAFTAMRVGEGTALRWTDVDETSVVVQRAHWRGRVKTTKTKRYRRVPLPKELAAILSDHRRQMLEAQGKGTERRREIARVAVASGWVFPSRKGGPTLPSVVRNALLRVVDALEEEATKNGRPAPLPHFTVHGLRRTMNNLLRQSASNEVTKSITGHVTDRMLEHYSTVSSDEKARAVAGVLQLVRHSRASTASEQVEVSVEVGASGCESGA